MGLGEHKSYWVGINQRVAALNHVMATDTKGTGQEIRPEHVCALCQRSSMMDEKPSFEIMRLRLLEQY